MTLTREEIRWLYVLCAALGFALGTLRLDVPLAVVLLISLGVGFVVVNGYCALVERRLAHHGLGACACGTLWRKEEFGQCCPDCGQRHRKRGKA